MRRRIDTPVIPNPSNKAAWHNAGPRQVIPVAKVQADFEVPELWRKHALEPWKVIFPNLEWEPPDRDL